MQDFYFAELLTPSCLTDDRPAHALFVCYTLHPAHFAPPCGSFPILPHFTLGKNDGTAY